MKKNKVKGKLIAHTIAALYGDQNSQTEAQCISKQQLEPDSPGSEPGSACESLESEASMGPPLNFKGQHVSLLEQPLKPEPGSCSLYTSLKSEASMGPPVNFKGQQSSVTQPDRCAPESPGSVSSCVFLKSQASMGPPLNFKTQQSSVTSPDQRAPESPGSEPGSVSSNVYLKSEASVGPPLNFKAQHSSVTQKMAYIQQHAPKGPCKGNYQDFITKMKQKHFLKRKKQTLEVPSGQFSLHPQTDLDSIFKVLEDKIFSFVRTEIKKFKMALSSDYTKGSINQTEDESVLDDEDSEQSKISRELFLKLALDFLRRINQIDLADHLLNKTSASFCKRQLKSNLKKKMQQVFEGIPKAGNPTLLNQIFTELHITEGGTGEVNDEHEVMQIERAFRKQENSETRIQCKDIFKPFPGAEKPVRTVLTKGVAGIGKTVLTQKFTLDWAEDKANKDIQFVFPFTFRELNVLKEKRYSLVKLVSDFFAETKGLCRLEEVQVAFIFDGLDECRLPLDFYNNEVLTNVTEPNSIDVLLTNLIRGNLLPSAHIWITTRPAAASQIPPEFVDKLTEVRGFTKKQREEYFRKRFGDEEQASKIISHIKASRSLHIMCHIPVFCWITATVLGKVFDAGEKRELPKTLTEMYIHFLVVQSKIKNIKFNAGAETAPHWSEENRTMISTLAKLAFEQLQKGNLIFYKSDLTECGIDTTAASVYSGVLTEIFREEKSLYYTKVYCFVHLSVQEFLAALHVYLTYVNTGVNLLSERQKTLWWAKVFKDKPKLKHLYKCAVDKALHSPNGHLDLFLRFLLGLSLQTNLSYLQGLLSEKASGPAYSPETVEYIKERISENQSPERSINLFHCLNELNDCTLLNQIQKYLKSGSLSIGRLSPALWSALVFVLLSSQNDFDVFDLKKYFASDEALLRLLQVVKVSNTALLCDCRLSWTSCEALSLVIRSQSSSLRVLDLSDNDLHDFGVKLLAAGLQSTHCKLEILRLSGCLVTKGGCASLALALRCNPSHLRELDLSYNHPEASGAAVLHAGLKDPSWRLETLRLDHDGEQRLKPGLRKYFFELTLDANTADRFLKMSENNKTVTLVEEEQLYPEYPERFDCWQLLCKNTLSGRCYWEVEWKGDVHVAVTLGNTQRKGDSDGCWFGRNEYSWTLHCSDRQYFFCHNKKEKFISQSRSISHRVAVYVDCSGGILSFYSVTSDSLIHLHTVHTPFTEPLYAGFGFTTKALSGSSVSLCPV